jgi:predicted extracellular nuclease
MADLLFSEYIEGSSNNKALEIYNGTGAAIDLSLEGYIIQMYFNGNNSPGLTINLTGTVADEDVFVIAQSSANEVILTQADQTNGSGWFNGDDAIVLRKGGVNGTIVDSIGQIGFDPGTEWGSGLTSTADNTLRRKLSVTNGDTNPSDVFDPSVEWDGYAIDTFDDLGTYTTNGGATPSLSLSVSPTSFLEAAGNNAAIGTLTRTGSTASALTVTLASSDTSEATVPTTVEIPAGESSITFDIAAVDDAIADGSQTVTFTASASGFTNGTTTVTVTDDETTPGTIRIRDIQGASHVSPLVGQTVSGVPGIVTALRSNGFYLQDPNPDNSDATSEGIFVFTSSAPTVTIGDSVLVSGTVSEFRPGGSDSNNLSITQIGSNPNITVLSSGNSLPTATILGNGGRTIPTTVIEDDANGSVETSGSFDPAQDGIDFYESVEGMLVQVNNGVAVGPTNDFGEIPVLADNGVNAGVRTTRGGMVIQPDDFNPERIIIDDAIIPNEPQVNVGDSFNGSVTGVIDYSFGNFKLLNTAPLLNVTSGGLTQETTTLTGSEDKLTVATFNVENLDPGDGSDKFTGLASAIVNNLNSPDIVSLEEVQDNNGPTNDSVVDASLTYQTLINAIAQAGGPTYEYRQIDPVDDQDGGQPGGNIRVGFLFNPNRVDFVDRPGGTSTTNTTVSNGDSGPELSASPGRLIDTDLSNADAFEDSRKPVVGEFVFNGNKVFVVGNHFNSKGGDQPLFGRFQPPTLTSEAQRIQQAEIVNNFVDSVLAADPNANVVVMGDLNDFQFSNPIATLKGNVLTNLIDTLPLNEQYTYIFEGNSQVLDHILVSDNLVNRSEFDVVHINAEFANQVSDHDPVMASFTLPELYNEILGTAGNDHLVGTAKSDRIQGLAKNDTLKGLAGNDKLYGDAGNDKLYGGEGNDIIYAGQGNDKIYADDGDDVIFAEAGNNKIDSGLGFDTVFSGSGRDAFVLASGEGFDRIENFTVSQDRIELSGLKFADITITQGTGTDANNTLITMTNTEDFLASLIGVQANTITSSVFSVI